MKKNKVIVLLMLVCIICKQVHAQFDNINREPAASFYAIGRPSPTEIKLRWAPNNYNTWRANNEEGYIIQRLTITKAGKVLPIKETKILTANAIKPKQLQDWETIAKNNKYAAIAAMALYGKNFTVDVNNNLAAKLLNQHKEDEQRFMYCLFSCDQSYEVAQQAGLAYTDKNVINDETYLYRIIAGSGLKTDTALVFTGLPEYRPMPSITDIVANFGDKSVAVSWNHKMVEDQFSSYMIEKSTDGKNFTAANKEPFAPLIDKLYNGITLFADSLANNNVTYYYRIKGRNAFGEDGPYSSIVKGAGKNKTIANAAIERAEIITDNTVAIEWKFPAEVATYIKDFKIIRATSYDAVYDTLYTGIKNTERKIILSFKGAKNKEGIFVNKELFESNYIAIAATNFDGSTTTSFPLLVQTVDSIAPAAPINVAGIIDSATGKVTLTWKANTEKDLLGYRIFRANKKTEELFQITASPIDTTMFLDTVQVQSLNNKVYYKIVAVDKHFNMSTASSIIELKKPYSIKPSSPVFKAYEIKNKKIELSWAESNTVGVIKHILYKKAITVNSNTDEVIDTKDMQVVKSFSTKESKQFFTDADALPNVQYVYALQAVNEDGVVSDAAKIYVTNNTQQALAKDFFQIKQLKIAKDKTALQTNLQWETTGTAVVESFYIYKGVEGNAVSLLKIVSGSQKTFTDTEVEKDNKYNYAIRAVLSNGTQTILVNGGKINF